jgi:glycosyltransferase involved in cell wall biosynthesis
MCKVPLKIWIVIAYDPVPEVDHGARTLRYGSLAQDFRKAGHEVVFWTSTFNHAKKVNRFEENRTVVVDALYSVCFLHAPLYRRNGSLRRVMHNRVLARAFIAETGHKERPDVIFVGIPCVELAEAAVSYGNRHGVPVVVDVQDLWPDIYLNVFPKYLRGVARRLLGREFERARRTCRGAAGITAVSHSYLQWGLVNAGRSQGELDGVFYLGGTDPFAAGEVPVQHLRRDCAERYQIAPGKTHAVYLGQFGNSYDVQTVIRAAALAEQFGDRNLNYVLIGGGDAEKSLREQARGAANVQFLGWLDAREATGVLLNCHVGLAAYAGKATQSMPYKPFEYIAVGLPIVSSLEGELRALIKAKGLGEHYMAGDPHSLAAAVHALVVDEPHRVQAGRNARALFKRKFNATIVYPQFREHLLRVANRQLT